MKLLGVKIPTIGQIVTFAVTMLITLFVIRILPVPDSVKNLFRI